MDKLFFQAPFIPYKKAKKIDGKRGLNPGLELETSVLTVSDIEIIVSVELVIMAGAKLDR